VSHHEYQTSSYIEMQDYSFRALIMAAMREAPSIEDLDALRDTYPEIWIELDARYKAPGGYLPGEPGTA
jgi:hypothetical protein